VPASKIIIVLIFLGILVALGSALISLVKGGQSDKTARSLTLRVGISVGLFCLLFVLWGLGFIQPHGIAR
jgi:hypothetical protein